MLKTINVCFLCILLSASCKNKDNQNEQKDTFKFKFKPRFFWVIVDAAVIRTEPSITSDNIGLVKEGDGVMVVDATGKEETIGGRKGEWMKVRHNDKDGFIFGGLISEQSDMFIEPMRKDDTMIGLTFSCRHDFSSCSNFTFRANNEIEFYYGEEYSTEEMSGIYQVLGNTVFVRINKGRRTERNGDPMADPAEEPVVDEEAVNRNSERVFVLSRSENGKIESMKQIGEEPDVYSLNN
ncbi:MAG: SH3 domain-containing protein [Spirochaetes bacterium]|nr:SH3 domain-containing protein [Spirochaetota bacterium]